MLTRRQFLALPLALTLAPLARRHAAADQRAGTYAADIGILYDILSFRLEGAITEWLDREAGRYRVLIRGRGSNITTRVDSSGMLLGSRWAPVRTHSRFVVYGRESRLEIAYDYDRGTITYRGRSETFVLRRLRIVDDRLAMPEAGFVDDVVSAAVNYADGRWIPEADGTFRTSVVGRRRSSTGDGGDVDGVFGAELVPFVLTVTPDPASGNQIALVDLTAFSSWARADRPGRIVFGRDRRPRTITCTLILGSSLNVRLWGERRGGAPYSSAAAGRRIVKVVPRPGSDSTPIAPP